MQLQAETSWLCWDPARSHPIPPHPAPAAGASGVLMPSAAQGNSSLRGVTQEANSTTGIKFLKQKKKIMEVLDKECNTAVLAVPWQSGALTCRASDLTVVAGVGEMTVIHSQERSVTLLDQN